MMKKLLGVLVLFMVVSGAKGQDTPYPVITAENVAQIELLAAVGGDRIYDIDWSPDGEYIAVFSQNNMTVYDSTFNESSLIVVDPCRNSQYPCRGTVDFSEDSKTLVVGSGYHIRTYDTTIFNPLAVYQTQLDTSILLYSQTHKFLIYGGGPVNSESNIVQNFDVSAYHAEIQPIDFWEDRELRGIRFWGGPPSSMAITPDAHYLLIANHELMVYEPQKYMTSASTKLFDLQALFNALGESNEQVFLNEPENDNFSIPIEGITNIIYQVEFSPDGAFLAAADVDGQIKLWSVQDWTLLTEIAAHPTMVWDIAFSPDSSQLVSAGGDGTLRFWNVMDGVQERVIDRLGSAITSITFSPDGSQLAAGGWDGSLWIFDTTTGEIIASRPGRWWAAWNITFNADGTRFALGNNNNEVILYDVIDQPPFIMERAVFSGHQGPVYAVAFHPDGRHLASGGSDGMIYVWDIETGETTETLKTNPHSPVYGLAYSPDGTQLKCATFKGQGEVYHQYAGPECSIRDEQNAPVYSVTYNADGTLFAFGDTRLFNLERRTSLTLDTVRDWWDSYRSKRSKLSFSADGSALLNSGTSQFTYVWQMDALADGIRLPEGLMVISPDGSLVAGGGLMIFDAINGERLLPLEEPRNYSRHYHTSIRDAVFNPDGTLIVTAGVDGTLRFWGIPSD